MHNLSSRGIGSIKIYVRRGHGLLVGFFRPIFGLPELAGLRPDFGPSTREIIHNTHLVFADARMTVLELTRGPISELLWLTWWLGFGRFFNFFEFSGLGADFGLLSGVIIHNAHLVLLNAWVTVPELTRGHASQHLWSTWWSDLWSDFRSFGIPRFGSSARLVEQ